MAMKKKSEIIRYCAGAVFALQAVSWLVGGLYILGMLMALYYVAIGASFFVKKPVLATVGQAVRLLLIAIVLLISLVDGESFRLIELIQIIPTLASEIIFIVLTITRKKQLGIAAAVASGIGCLGDILLLHSPPTVGMILVLAGYVLAGFAFEAMPSKASAKVLGTTQSSVSDKIQRMEKLYTLLEKGILTEEEFEAKKKQLLNL